MLEDEVCMRLVEFTRKGRVFRKWTFERCGDKSCSGKPPDCFSHKLIEEGLSNADDDDDSVRISRRRR
ncbi:hypothetical protein Y032_0147g2594 [Ancylostoma ceylanicum]|uniref:Uncharacterized protein n=1 Tax=Ancylostoma ceylanicum TaxID=53326 RepID=A0A016T2F3_9BILA|nr:hypothetical protein Y032_0147g2594 [Ancylostoma ceylanicum]